MADIIDADVSAHGCTVTKETDARRWSAAIQHADCDLIITDLKAEVAGDPFPGNTVVENVFKYRFVPLIVHSGIPQLRDQFSPEYVSHPFVRIEEKGEEGMAKVVEGVD